MKYIYLILFNLIASIFFSQNWAVFNPNYRYNYSLESENYTTVVIFTDSVITEGTDTIYSLNRIAAKCDSCFFYYSEPGVEDSNYIMVNQPQFMQRRIVYSNKKFRFSDPSNFIMPRYSSVGDTWLYDTINNISAQHIQHYTQNYFNVLDSIKTILLSTNDTIKISKQFGIIKYPIKYGLNKYYVLRGIENSQAYDVQALYGEKVPNYYDFFKYKPGAQIFYSLNSYYFGVPSSYCYGYKYGIKKIINSSIIGDTISVSGTDTYKGCGQNCQVSSNRDCQISYSYPWPSTSVTINNFSYNDWGHSNTTSDHYNSYNNKYYFPDIGLPVNYVLVVKFGKTSNNHFYKTSGWSCFSSHIRNNPIANSSLSVYYKKSTQNPEVYYYNGFDINDWPEYGETFIEGYGQVNDFARAFESVNYYCVSGIIDGNDTLGNPTTVDVVLTTNDQTNNNNYNYFPNPTKDIVYINLSDINLFNVGIIEVKDIYGRILIEKEIKPGMSSENVNIQEFSPGIYFIDVKTSHFQKQFKVIKQ